MFAEHSTGLGRAQPAIVDRFAALDGDQPLDRPGCDAARIEPGTMRDYAGLARFHYRGGRPTAVTAVYRAVHDGPTVIGRYRGCASDTEVVGVLVVTRPPLDCALRTIATSARYAGLGRREAARLLNREVRTIARVVIDPAWRGTGLAVRLVRYALAESETIYTEALAAMGRVHPFFERAGMTRYDRPPHPADQRLLDALAMAGIDAHLLASPRIVAERIAALELTAQQCLDRALRRWHRVAGAGRNRRNRPHSPVSRDAALDAARRRLLSRPVYYLVRRL